MSSSTIKPRTLITGHLRYLEARFPDAVSSLKHGDPLAELWVIVPNQLTRLHLQRSLAHRLGAAANVRFKTITDLMHAVAEPLMISEGWVTLSESAADPLLANVIDKTKHELRYLSSIADSPGFRSALLRTRRELILNEINLADLESVPFRERERADKVRDLILLLREMDAEFTKLRLHDGASLQTIAQRANLNQPQPLPSLILYSLYELPPLTRSILEVLIARTPVITLLPWLPESAAYTHTGTLARWFQSLDFLHDSEPKPETSYAPVRLVSVPRSTAIPSEVIRDILHDHDIRVGEAAVLLPGNTGELTAIFAARCAQVGLHPYIYQARSLGESAPGRGLAAFVELLDGKFRREQVVAFLSSAPFKPAVASRCCEWRRFAEEALVIEGAGDWIRRVERNIERLEYRAAKLSEREEDEVPLAVLRRRIEIGRSLLEFVSQLIEVVQSIRRTVSWQSAVALLWEHYCSQVEMDEDFAEFTRQIEQVDLLDQAGVRCTPMQLRSFILSALSTPGTRIGSFGTGTPLVAPREQSVGSMFPHAFLPGFDEGTLPQRQRQDPLLLDSDRAVINSHLSRNLPLSVEAGVRERFLLEMQLRSAVKSITLFISRADAEGRPQLKSPYVAELLAVQTGQSAESIDIDNILESDPHRWVVANPLEHRNARHAINENEYHRATLGQALTEKSTEPLQHLMEDLSFRKALQVEHSRFRSKELREYEGALAGQALLNDFALRFSPAHPLSATALEDYWKCPFRYMALRLWEVYAPEEMDALLPIGDRERGTILHQILQRYHGERIDKPVSAQFFPLAALKETAHVVINEYMRGNSISAGFAVQSFERNIHKQLEVYHGWLLGQGGSWRTRHVEVSFGYGEEPFPDPVVCVTALGDSLRFAGRVDRLDSDDDKTHAVVIDYKSGKKPDTGTRSADRRLQLAVYHALANSMHSDATVRSLYYYFRSEDDESSDESDLIRQINIAGALVGDMRRGLFVPDPAPNDSACCLNCSVKLTCGSQRHSRKQLTSSTVKGMMTERSRPEESAGEEDDDE